MSFFYDALQLNSGYQYAKLKKCTGRLMNGGERMQLPAMVRLVGKISGEDRIYIEDYVYTYLHKLRAEEDKLPVRAALFGHILQREDRKLYMVYGAANVTCGLREGEEQVRKEFFEDYELIGYVNIYSGSRQERAEKKNGYYIFCEDNEAMQNYLLACFERKRRKPVSAEKTSFSSVGELLRKFFYGACIIILAIAVTAINDYDKLYGFAAAADRAAAMTEAGK